MAYLVPLSACQEQIDLICSSMIINCSNMWCLTILIVCPAVMFVVQNCYSSVLIVFELFGI